MTGIPASSDPRASWDYLVEGVDHIMSRLDSGLTYSKYMQLYTVAYNCCTPNQASHYSNSGIRASNASLDLKGPNLYNRLLKYFVTHLRGLRTGADDLEDEPLLRYYVDKWNTYTLGASYVNRLFTFLNRDWIKKEREAGRRQIYEVYGLALDQWKTNFFIPLQQIGNKVTHALLRQVEKQRNGEIIDQGLVHTVVDSFVAIGISKSNDEDVSLLEYRTHFEAPLLLATETYYTQESIAYLQSHSVSEYVQRIPKLFRDEEDRVDRYMHTSSRLPLYRKCEDVLVQRYRTTLEDFFSTSLGSDEDSELRCVFTLLTPLKESRESLRVRFGKHVVHSGKAAVEKLVGNVDGSSNDVLDASAYVEALLNVYHKNVKRIKTIFKTDVGFVTQLDKACGSYINNNAATGNLSSTSPELLAKYVDLLLRKNNKSTPEDLEPLLRDAMTIFKYIDNKDVFQSFYTSRLSKRLIYGASASEEAEQGMISRLKDACGFEYTHKLQRLFTDVNLSRDMSERFQNSVGRHLDLTFSIIVGGQNVWQLPHQTHNFTIPPSLYPTFERFTQWYSKAHQGRKLTWLWNHSRMEIRTNYFKQRHILMTSAFQSAVLLQYNAHDTLSLEDLLTATSLPEQVLRPVVGLLVKAKVLLSDEEGQYDLNPDFKSKRIRVNLNQPIRNEAKQEDKVVLDGVEEDRKFVTQATIVRIMKARKVMKSQQLLQEAVSQLSRRFRPKIADLKKQIDILLEKEYIERGQGQDTYSYVA